MALEYIRANGKTGEVTSDAMKAQEKNMKKYDMNANQCRETRYGYMNESKDASGNMQHKVLLKK